MKKAKKPGKEPSAADLELRASRARAKAKFRADRAESLKLRDDRVKHVRYLIETHRYLGASTERELAIEWKRSRRNVQSIVAEARREIRFDFDGQPKEERIAVLAAACDRQLASCNQERNRSAWVRVAEFQARLLGLEQPQKVEVSSALDRLLAVGLETDGDPGSQGTPDPVAE